MKINECFFGVALILLLTSMLNPIFSIQLTQAQTPATIYIRPDGSVDPSTAPIQRDEELYKFTNSIYDSGIIVERNDIVIDGNGYSLQGSGSGNGFYLNGLNNITIKNTNITNFEMSIRLDSSNNNTFSGNNITNNLFGIFLVSSESNTIAKNNVTNNNRGIFLRLSENNTISGNNIKSNSERGIQLYESATNNTIKENYITNNYEGIYLSYSCNNNTISRNNITKSGYDGLFLSSSNYNSILENNIAENVYGIHFYSGCIDNIVSGNNITNNDNGVFPRTFDNQFFHNNFVYNSQQVYIQYPYDANIWDDGYPSGGNYWSDYEGVDSNSDGLGDTPYFIDVNNQDNYPLMEPYSVGPVASFEFSPTDPIVDEEIEFDASVSEGEIVSYLWNFGDNTMASGVTVQHSFSSSGNYEVSLTVTDNNGAMDSISQEINVEQVNKKMPVLLVHGFQGNVPFSPVSIWKEMAEYLSGNEIGNVQPIMDYFWKLEAKDDNFRNVYISNYAIWNDLPTFLEIRFYASVLSSEIEIMKNIEDVNKVDIIAHSMGGLVSRAYIENQDFGSNPYGIEYRYDVRKLVMVGTPNHGDLLAFFAIFLPAPAVLDMLPISYFINSLNQGGTGESLGVEYSTIAGNPLSLSLPTGLFMSDGVVSVESVTLDEVPSHRSFIWRIWHGDLPNHLLSKIAVKYILELPSEVQIPNFMFAGLGSDAEIRVYDSSGRVTGLVNGEMIEEIPDSVYDNEAVLILSPIDFYSFEVFGTNTGHYSLDIITYENGEQTDFRAVEIQITANEVHHYSVDWQALSQGEEGVTLEMDCDGDGEFEVIITTDNDLTQAELMLQTTTAVDCDPDTLLLDAKIRWITAYIELPVGYDYDVSMIDVASLQLNGLIEAELKPTEISDYNENGIADLMVKFSGSSVQEILGNGDEVELTLSGNLYDGRQLNGKDRIKVICSP